MLTTLSRHTKRRSSWISHPPARVSNAEIDALTQPKAVPNSNPVSSQQRAADSSSCNRGGRANHNGGAEFTVAKQRIVDDSSSSNSVDTPFDDEAEGGIAGGGGGGGGGRVGSLPSFPRTLPATNSKAPLNKKFGWVP